MVDAQDEDTAETPRLQPKFPQIPLGGTVAAMALGMRDLRYAIRQLGRSPGFTVVALLTLALGMGANTAFFSVLYDVVLREPAYPDAARLVAVHNLQKGAPANGGRLSRAEFQDYRSRQRAFSGLAAADLGRATLTASAGEPFAERVKISHVSAEFFSVFGVAPVRGRTFVAGDANAGMQAVISHELWQSQFGGAANILERTVRLNGVELDIVGVMPAGFAYPEPEMGVWTPIDFTPQGSSDRNDHYLGVVGRLANGVSAGAARADLDRVAAALQRDLPAEYPAAAQPGIGFESLRESQFGGLLAPLGTLMAAAAFVLLIACVNVAIMSLLRALGRRRELSIRLALGASRGAVIRQLAVEAGVLSAGGAIGGFLLAQTGLGLLKAFAPASVPRLDDAAIAWPAVLFAGVTLVLVTLLVGLAPAFVAFRIRAFDGLTAIGRSSDGRANSRVRDALTITEIALAAALLFCAGLTLRSLYALTAVDLGFATEQRFAFKTNLTPRAYPDADAANRFYEQLAAKLAAAPGTQSIGAISYLPLSGEGQAVEAAPADAADVAPLTVGWGIVRDRYFETMGVKLLAGRLFSADDRADAPQVAVIDTALADRLFGSATAALDRRVRFSAGGGAPQTRTVVGVVARVRHLGPGQDSLPAAYAPQSQIYQRGMYTVIRTTSTPQALMTDARAALASVDPTIPLYFAETVDQRYDEAIALPRFTAGLVSAFSALALVLAGVGIFGVTAYAAAQRSREFAIRTALGAQRTHVGGLVLSRVALLGAIGLAVGGGLGFGLSNLMSGILFGVERGDPMSMVLTLTGVGLTALLATVAPIRRAVRVNPADTLRAE